MLKLMRKSRALLLVILVLMLILPLTSCTTSQTVVEKTILPPAIEFPLIPEPFGVEYSEDGSTVSIPAEYWVQLAKYMIDTEAAIEKYLAIRDEYE